MSEQRPPSSSSEALRKLKQRQHPEVGQPSPPPRYELLGELGRGGVGVVYHGRDVDLSREVAMKVLHPEFAANPDVLDRFIEEAQIGGQLQHPGIVPVYEIGLQADDRPFFAMKLVKGVTLWAQLSKRATVADDRQRFLAAFAQVCQTMAFAHARRVVHRDLKPENVMIGAFGEVQVVDWGFAKVLPEPGQAAAPAPVRERPVGPPTSVVQTVRTQDGSGSKSMLGSVLGTPAYMPPEQALGDVERMDRRSDVFGLGGILCEILTGAPPYRGKGQEVLLQAARAQLDDAWRRLDECDANEVLIDLCRRCLQADPDARPIDAQQVADEVLGYLASVEQRARDAEIRGAEARVRARATAMMSAAALLVVLFGGGAYLYLARAAAERSERATARVAEARAAASVALGEARSAGALEAAPWQRAAAAVAEASALAGAEDVTAEERSRVALLAEQVAAESDAATAARRQRERDDVMRLAVAAVFGDDEGTRENASLVDQQRLRDRGYAARFRDYLGGRELDRMSVGEAVTALEHSAIVVELAVAIDDWALSRRDAEDGMARKQARAPDYAGVDHLRAIARAIDAGDPWRNRLRSVYETAAREPARFRNLFEAADWATLPAPSVRALAGGLWDCGLKEQAVTALERGLQRHPRDHALALVLGIKLGTLPAPRHELAAAALRTARAIAPSAQVDLVLANHLARSGEVQQAEALLRQLLAEHPDMSGAHNGLGVLYLEQRRWDEAAACFEQALRVGEPAPAVLTNIGNVYFGRRDHDAAVGYFHRALEIDPDYVNGLSNLATSLRILNRNDEAMAAAQKACELDPQHPSALVELANQMELHRRPEEAQRLFERAIELSPRNAAALVGMGLRLRRRGEFDAALGFYRRAVEADPDEPVTHDNIAMLLGDLGRGQEGLDYLAGVLPGLRDAVGHEMARAACYRSLGRLPEAEAALRAGTERFPGEHSVWFQLAQAVGDQGRPEEAIGYLLRAQELGNDSAVLHSNLAASFAATGDAAKALEHARVAVERDPGHAPSRFNLAQNLLRKGARVEGLENLREARRLWSLDGSTYGKLWYGRSTTMLAGLLEMFGDTEGARDALAEALETIPGDLEVRINYANTLSKLKQAYAAQRQYERILTEDPDHAVAWMNLAARLSDSGKGKQALGAAHRAEELFAADDSSFARMWRGRARRLAERLDKFLETSRENLPVARGEREAGSAADLVAAATGAYALEDYVASMSGWQALFERWPETRDEDPYAFSAACAATLAMRGDDATPDERAARRALALGWLRADLSRIAAMPVDTGEQRGTVREHLQRFVDDPDLVAVRGDEQLARMPVEQVDGWRELWGEVQRRLAALGE
ncbi:MAG: tetratricopeptide repeat protein [Planctomycetes bacterium]|nr:tetratricopeptide repeat protein [Planctomycetota bacterium]